MYRPGLGCGKLNADLNFNLPNRAELSMLLLFVAAPVRQRGYIGS